METKAFTFKKIQIAFWIIAPVKHNGNLRIFSNDCTVSEFKLLHHIWKLSGIPAVAWIRFTQDWYGKIRCDKQCQPHCFQIIPLCLVMTSFRKARRIHGINISKEICGIIDKITGIDVKRTDWFLKDPVFYRTKLFHGYICVIPEILWSKQSGF